MSDGIACPGCGATGSSVVDSRDDAGRRRRRRECDGCGFRFTTYEGLDVGHFDLLLLTGLDAKDRVALKHLAERLRGDG
jgi:transcriptional regulator NrdR family protein